MKLILDTPDINSVKQLQSHIRLLKNKNVVLETELKERWKQLPKEAIKATLGSAIPIFLNGRAASGIFGIVKNLVGFIGKKTTEEKSTVKEKLTGSIKKAGVFTALNLLFSLIKRKS